MACTHISNVKKQYCQHDFKMVFANLAHANEIQMCYDVQTSYKNIPWIIIHTRALICTNVCLNPLTPKISSVILRTVCHSYDVNLENLVLDQLLY